MRNFTPLVTGGARYRPGFHYVNHTRLNRIAFLLSFEFNDEQAYVLEFTESFMRVHKDGGNVLETAKNITGITKASPGVVTSAAHGFVNGNEVYISGVVGMTELNGQFYLVANKSTDTFELTNVDGTAISTAAMTAYASGGTVARVYEIATPYAQGDLFALKMAQNADLGYVVHPAYAPYKLSRTGHAAWALATFMRTNDPFTGAGKYPGAVGFYGGRVHFGGTDNAPESWWGSRGPDPTTGASRFDDFTTGSLASDAINYTITSQNGTADRIRWFSGSSKSLLIGTFGGVYKANGGSDGAPITPTAISVAPVSSYGTADINPIFVGSQTVYIENGARTLRSFEFDLMTDGYVAFDKNILADEVTYGGVTQIAFTQGRPDLIWATRADGTLLSCTFLAKEDVAGWARHQVGGSGKVLSVAADYRSDNFDRITACVERVINGVTRRSIEYIDFDPQIKDASDYYTADTAEVADTLRYRNLTFEEQKKFVRLDSSLILDTTQTTTLTLAALTGSSVVATAGASVFTAADVGKQIFIKYITGNETGVANIIAYTSGTEVTVQITQDFSTLNVPTSGWYKLTSTVQGLWHLEGASVGVVTDGGVHPNKTVANGAITLDYPARYVIVGFKYLGFVRSMDLEFGSRIGVSVGRPRNIHRLVFKFRDTMGGKYGTATRNLYKAAAIAFRKAAVDFMDRPPLLFSGTKELSNFDDWDIKKHFYFVQDEPQPMTVQAVIPMMDVATE